MDGRTLREHLENWERQTRQPHPMLSDAPPCPVGTESLWRDFRELHNSRATAGFGPARISWADIDAYQRVRGFQLQAWQVDAIRRADSEYMAQYAEAHRVKK